jgi:hypothetical protein
MDLGSDSMRAQTHDATPEQVAEAVELQRRLESPKYTQAVLVSDPARGLSLGRGEW